MLSIEEQIERWVDAALDQLDQNPPEVDRPATAPTESRRSVHSAGIDGVEVDALQRRLAAIVAGTDPGSVTEPRGPATIDLEPTSAGAAPKRFRHRVAQVVLAAAAVVAIALAIQGNDPHAPLDRPPDVAPTTTSAMPPSIEGQWSTGPIRIDQFKATLLNAGATSDFVDTWVADEGSPTEITVDLEFRYPNFTLRGAKPGSYR